MIITLDTNHINLNYFIHIDPTLVVVSHLHVTNVTIAYMRYNSESLGFNSTYLRVVDTRDT